MVLPVVCLVAQRAQAQVQVPPVLKYNSTVDPVQAWQTPVVVSPVVVSRSVHPAVLVLRKVSMREWPIVVEVQAKGPRKVHLLAWVNQVRLTAVAVLWALVAAYRVEHQLQIQPIWLNTAIQTVVSQPLLVLYLRKLQV